MKPLTAPVVADSKRLLKEIVSACAAYPQKYRKVLCDRTIDIALNALLRAQGAARCGRKRPEQQLHQVMELIELNDKLQALLDTAYDLNCFTSTEVYEQTLRLAAKVGAQAEGWKKQISSALPSKQSPEASSRPGRLGVLSADTASSEANP